ncbi:hypothetical protein A2765_02520 [Candidatus Kaiserbacteria bacterium RIFCSPHIGHO2_01_FULL_56_24]|uniref:Uncharacterized protein n=1 Tax=Candidatus Kaiserbacteria bacterium RIFCSPHIGHO2_01_FULL_56_24 TaxID=1798487 RepID=A0A1F6DB12_9BACT|nr:MAG: hypothetical protein A2765_02520 [Candidatus Kaiserbacteria bacterium RIFCSPHIGHO2_01_FULL_56_24]
MRLLHLSAWGAFVAAIALWCGFGLLVWTLYGERADFTRTQAAMEQDALRGESAARLHASVQDTATERASLESLLDMSILSAVEIIEKTGRQAGATDVSIGNASPLTGAATTKDLTPFSIVLNASGSFSSLMRAASLFETLTIPSTLEQFEMEKTGNSWKSTIHLKILLSSTAP